MDSVDSSPSKTNEKSKIFHKGHRGSSVDFGRRKNKVITGKDRKEQREAEEKKKAKDDDDFDDMGMDDCKEDNTKLLVVSSFILLSTITLILFSMAIVFSEEEREELGNARVAQRKGSRNIDPDAVLKSTRPKTNHICDTSECSDFAKAVSGKMNSRFNPCQSFIKFACVHIPQNELTWEEVALKYKNKILKNTTDMDRNTFDGLSIADRIARKKEHYTGAVGSGGDHDIKMRMFYQTCLDIDSSEVLGIDPYIDKQSANDWPTVAKVQVEYKLTDNIVTHLTKKSIAAHNFPLFKVDISNKTIYLSQPEVMLLPGYQKDQSNINAVHTAYINYYTTIADLLGAKNKTLTENDAEEVYKFELQLSKMLMKQEKPRLYALKGLNIAFRNGWFDWTELIQQLIKTPIKDSQPVILVHPSYFFDFNRILFTPRMLHNFFGFKHAVHLLDGLTQKIRKLKFDLYKLLQPQQYKMTTNYTGNLEEHCFNETIKIFKYSLENEFLKMINFTFSSKKKLTGIANNIKLASTKTIQNNSWLSMQAKTKILRKLRNLRLSIGYDKNLMNDSVLNDYYDKISVHPYNKYENRKNGQEFYYNKFFMTLAKEEEMKLPVYEDKIKYSISTNTLTVPAGITVAANFDSNVLGPAVYGVIGWYIAREITSLLNSTAYNPDKNKSVEIWWTTADQTNFSTRAKCLIDQRHSQDLFEEVRCMTGLKIATKAKDSPVVGGVKWEWEDLDYSSDQLFYISLAQRACNSIPKTELQAMLKSNKLQGEIKRINSMLQNSFAFSSTFECPDGSRMNPKTKCDVW